MCNHLSVRDFGAVGDGVTDDIAAFEAAIRSIPLIFTPATKQLGNTIIVPQGNYYWSRTLYINRPIVFQGAGGGDGQWAGTRIIVAQGHEGIVITRYNSSIDGGLADRSVLRDFFLQADGQSFPNKHGIRLWARAKIENVQINGFSGDGVHIVGSFGGPGENLGAWLPKHAYALHDSVINDGGNWYVCKVAGTSAATVGPTGTPSHDIPIVDGTVTWGYVSGSNANNWRLDHIRVSANGGHGIYCHGADSNAGLGIGVDASENSGYGIYDDSFLGNTWVGCHVATNRMGGYFSGGANARSVFLGCYGESDNPPSRIAPPSQVYGGLHANGVFGANAAATNQGLSIVNNSVSGIARFGENNRSTLQATGTTDGILNAGKSTIVLTTAADGIESGDVISVGPDQAVMCVVDSVSGDGLTVTVRGAFAAGTGLAITRYIGMSLRLGDLNLNTLMQFGDSGGGTTLDLKYFPIEGSTAAFAASDVFVWDQGHSNKAWGWGNTINSVWYFGGDVNNPRRIPKSGLFTAFAHGIMNEGSRYIHADDPTTRTECNYGLGDITFRRNAVAGPAGDNVGWFCMEWGNNGTYTEGLTLTTDGTAVATLSAATSALFVGDYISIAGSKPYLITGINKARTQIRIRSYYEGHPPAASGQAITYVAPTFHPFGNRLGPAYIGDSSGAPGNATVNKRHGVSAFAAGATTCVVTSNRVPAPPCIIHATLQTNDATLTQILSVVPNPTGGSFTVTGNAAATGTTNFCWTIDE